MAQSDEYALMNSRFSPTNGREPIYWVCPSCGSDEYEKVTDWRKRCIECNYEESNEPDWDSMRGGPDAD